MSGGVPSRSVNRVRAEISGVRGSVVVGRIERVRRPRIGLAVSLDGVPSGLAAIRPAASGAGSTFRFALPKHQIAATLDIADPLTGRSALRQPFDLSGHYRLAIEQFALDGLTVRGRFSVRPELDEFLHVQLLRDGVPASAVFARCSGGRDGAFAYSFAAPLPSLAALDRQYMLSARIAGAEHPELRMAVSYDRLGRAGYVERVADGAITGWAADLGDPKQRLALELIAGETVVARALADQYRKDAAAAGLGEARVGFRFAIPAPERTDAEQSLGVVLAGTRTHLVNSPIVPRRAARLRGCFDGMQGQVAAGWACDLDEPDTPLDVEIVCEGRVIASDTARYHRPDVEAAGVAPGKCGFRIDLGNEFLACLGKPVFAQVRDSQTVLDGSPHLLRENPNIRRFLDRSGRLNAAGLARLKRRLNHRARGRGLSIVMPVYNTPKDWLIEALESVRRQWCDHWELICVDDCSTEPHVLPTLQSYAAADQRISVLRSARNRGIARATNAGIRAARHDYIAFMDHDDWLEPDAVYLLLRAIGDSNADLLYSDELLSDQQRNNVLAVRARPAFSYDYYLSHPYFVHMVCVRAGIARKLRWDEAMPISADVDFVLRALEVARLVAHVPSVIYRWRTHETSTGHARQAQVMEATKGAIRRHLQRRRVAATVRDGPSFNHFRIDWPDDGGRILIVIPTRNKHRLLRACIESIERTGKGADYRIVVVDHESDEPASRAYLRQIARRQTVMRYKGEFNFPAINNLAVRRHGGDARYVLFLNNDIEALETGWLARLRSLAARPEVGAVGPLLLYGDRRVQHAGVIIGFNKGADHAMKFAPWMIDNGAHRNPGYNGSLASVRDYSAVTAACIMLRKDVFDAIGGFDEAFAIGFNDTDLCLRPRAAGLKVLYDGFTTLLHHESATRSETKQVLHPADAERLRQRWAPYFAAGDPFYNPNLDHDATDHQCARTPRVAARRRRG